MTEYLDDLTLLLNGRITPRSVVGTGYRYPKQVASQWLRRMAHEANGRCVDDVRVLTSGKAFSSVEQAKRSKYYIPNNELDGTDALDSPSLQVEIVPELAGDGFEIHLIVNRKPPAF